jgi:hypothetical protein
MGRTINKSAHADANLQLVMLIANYDMMAKWFNGLIVDCCGSESLIMFGNG